MGVDISMTVGIGIHLSDSVVEEWMEANDPDEDSYSRFEEILDPYPGLTFEWVGNAWVGDQHGYLILSRAASYNFEMGRQAEAGVYRPGRITVPLSDRTSLNEIAKMFTGSELPIEPLIGVSVS